MIVPVTVVIPTVAGHDDLLARAMASVEAQTAQPAGHLIVVLDSRRRGAAWARNQGLAQVATEWVAWLDDDDVLLPHHLAGLWAATLDPPEPDLVYSYPRFVEDRPGFPPPRDPLATCDDHGRLVAAPIGVPFGPRQAAWLRERGNFIPICYLARTRLLRQVGGFPPSGGPGREEDYQLLLKLLDAGARFRHLGRVTWEYHLTGRNTGGGWHGTGASNEAAFRG
jgi:glycosyltransferase involved in cell wall biosynthesis